MRRRGLQRSLIIVICTLVLLFIPGGFYSNVGRQRLFTGLPFTFLTLRPGQEIAPLITVSWKGGLLNCLVAAAAVSLLPKIMSARVLAVIGLLAAVAYTVFFWTELKVFHACLK